jgi:hypothetical protein
LADGRSGENDSFEDLRIRLFEIRNWKIKKKPMYFYPKAKLKFHLELTVEEIISQINYIRKADSEKVFHFAKMKSENRFEIIVIENGFELKERFIFLFSPVNFYKIAEAKWTVLEKGIELKIEVTPPNWFLIVQMIKMLFIGSFFSYFLFPVVGVTCLLFPFLIYFFFMFQFSRQVWQIEDLVIHKISNKKARKIQT